MKLFKLSILFYGFCLFNASAQNPVFNKKMADSLGADEFGMKEYVFVLIKTGEKIEKDKAKLNALFVGHMANINRLADLGKLSLAGPFLKNDKNYRGLFILDVNTIEEAREILQTDPVIKAGIFNVELTKWYGSAALSEVLKIHKKVAKSNP